MLRQKQLLKKLSNVTTLLEQLEHIIITNPAKTS